MKLSPQGITLIHYFETCRLEAYPDPGSADGKPWTIGWGHTGPEVKRGLKWTQQQADEAFKMDIEKFESGVLKLVKVVVNQSQFDALVSFAYNVGIGSFASSTLLIKLNRSDFLSAASEFLRWNKNDGKVMLGLSRRRAAEQALFTGQSVERAIKIASTIK